jgi:hypothetical protein
VKAILVGGPAHGHFLGTTGTMETIEYRSGDAHDLRVLYTRAPHLIDFYRPDEAMPFAVPSVRIRGLARIIDEYALTRSEVDEVALAKEYLQRQAVIEGQRVPPISRGVWVTRRTRDPLGIRVDFRWLDEDPGALAVER